MILLSLVFLLYSPHSASKYEKEDLGHSPFVFSEKTKKLGMA